ncbi:MAG: OmpA family protein [Gemmatimonadetes bacterium]|nr:OmpA family protein [Gemmatimonadota bacterium]NNM34747.1 OmpA family protein [Gemmatimonadota bacterium]
MQYRISRPVGAVLSVALLFSTAACASLRKETQAEEGAAIGAATGAVIGGIIGNNNGSTAKGAILGAVIGGAAGAAIGSQMDEQADDLASQLEGATVERVGEGIQVTFDSGLLFGFDSDRLQPTARANLADLAESLMDFDDTEILIIGHTDASGSDSYNQGLSERRADAAAAHLIQNGISARRVDVMGLGEAEPVADNSSEWGRQENRRVEVAIFASEYRRRALMGSR